jgi:hypothetical protein
MRSLGGLNEYWVANDVARVLGRPPKTGSMPGDEMHRYREIYWTEQLPLFQRRMFHSELEASIFVKGDVILVYDRETGLIFNSGLRSDADAIRRRL